MIRKMVHHGAWIGGFAAVGAMSLAGFRDSTGGVAVLAIITCVLLVIAGLTWGSR